MHGKILIRSIALAASALALTGAGIAGAQVEPPPERNAPPGSNDIPDRFCELAVSGSLGERAAPPQGLFEEDAAQPPGRESRHRPLDKRAPA